MWTSDARALDLLDDAGPFATQDFREAVTATVPGWRDVSFGARARDGTVAAVPLLAFRRAGESVPPAGYGCVVSSRPLEPAEVNALLDRLWRESKLRTIRLRLLGLPDAVQAGRLVATASAVPVGSLRYARLARRSMNRAREAGAIVHDGSTDMFWSIYEPASEAWGMTFPEPLLRRLVAVGAARIHAVRTDERPVSVLLTLVGRSHWMCWLAAQTAEGRRMAASYLAYDALFAAAKAAGGPYVNLGASVGDGAEFKHHLGASRCQCSSGLAPP